MATFTGGGGHTVQPDGVDRSVGPECIGDRLRPVVSDLVACGAGKRTCTCIRISEPVIIFHVENGAGYNPMKTHCILCPKVFAQELKIKHSWNSCLEWQRWDLEGYNSIVLLLFFEIYWQEGRGLPRWDKADAKSPPQKYSNPISPFYQIRRV